jgi:hypothetical protein
MSLDLSDDRRNGKRGELLAAAAVVALDRVQQPDRAGLDEVIVLDVTARVPVGEALDQR